MTGLRLLASRIITNLKFSKSDWCFTGRKFCRALNMERQNKTRARRLKSIEDVVK